MRGAVKTITYEEAKLRFNKLKPWEKQSLKSAAEQVRLAKAHHKEVKSTETWTRYCDAVKAYDTMLKRFKLEGYHAGN